MDFLGCQTYEIGQKVVVVGARPYIATISGVVLTDRDPFYRVDGKDDLLLATRVKAVIESEPPAPQPPLAADWRDRIKVKCPNCGASVNAKDMLRGCNGSTLLCLFAGESTLLACTSCETYFPAVLTGCFQFVVT